MEFSSREEMLKFEREREQYLMHWISISNRGHLLEFYKLLILETFHPKYRAIKKKYEGYNGGWYRDKHGYPTSAYIWCIDQDRLSEGDICIERDDEAIYGVFMFAEGMMRQILTQDELRQKALELEYQFIGGNAKIKV